MQPFPYAGINQFRFEGFALRPAALLAGHP
jgi:hypothetical protein